MLKKNIEKSPMKVIEILEDISERFKKGVVCYGGLTPNRRAFYLSTPDFIWTQVFLLSRIDKKLRILH